MRYQTRSGLWINRAVMRGMKVLKDELASLVERSNGLHSNTSRTTKASIYQFSITDLAQRYQTLAPHLSSIAGSISFRTAHKKVAADSASVMVLTYTRNGRRGLRADGRG